MPKTRAKAWRFIAMSILFSFSAVLVANEPPQFNSEPPLIAVPEFEYKYGVSVSDPDGDAVTLSASGLPDWLALEVLTTPELIVDGPTWPNGVSGMGVMASAPDGKLWFWNNQFQLLQKMNPDGSELENIPCDYWVNGIDITSDGTVYIVGDHMSNWELGGLAKLHPDSSTFEFVQQYTNCKNKLDVSNDGSVWFIDNCSNFLVKATEDTLITYTELGAVSLSDVAVHPDGTVWFTEEVWEGRVRSFNPENGAVTTIFENGEQQSARGISINDAGIVAVVFQNPMSGIFLLNETGGFDQLYNGWIEYISTHPVSGEFWGNTSSELVHISPLYDFLMGTPMASDHGEYDISISADDGQGNVSTQDFTLMVDSTVVLYSFNLDTDEFTSPDNWDHISEGVALGWIRGDCMCSDCPDVHLINYIEETCYQFWDPMNGGGSPAGTRWSNLSTDESSLLSYFDGADYWSLMQASNEGRAVSMWDLTENKMYDIQPLGQWPEPWSASGEIAYLRFYKGDGYILNPTILSIDDVPNDQGGRVYLSFQKSAYDMDGIDGRSTESYTVQRKDGDTWVSVASAGAYGEDEYVIEVSTLNDSTGAGNNASDFRVIANMDEGTYVSEVVTGYSVDNIAPGAPDDLDGQIVDGAAELTWAASTANDLAHYNVYRGVTEDFIPNEETFVGESSTSNFIDADVSNGDNYYVVTAVDVHDNESDPSAPVNLSVLSTGDGQLLPEVVALHQNYPNPFNPTTTLRYDLPEATQVQIIVYDLMGHQIKSLVNSHQNAGFKSVVWDATNELGQPVSAGMYIYRISSDNFHAAKKMILMK